MSYPTPPYTPETFKPLLLKLMTSPTTFTPTDTHLAIAHLATPDGATGAQIGSFLTALTLSQRDSDPAVLAACAGAMRERSVSVTLAVENDEEGEDFHVDIVGTGGDGHNTFNVSTSAAIVAAGAGARVIKHGNKASTSSSGSADVLQALGCKLPAPTTPPTPLPKIPFIFLLASHYHPAMALLSPHRKSLPFRTLFNVLGPLINPAPPKGMVLGVANPSFGPIFAQTLKSIGVKRALVVCGAEHLDEISIAGPTYAWRLSEDGNVDELTLEPAQFGVETHALSTVAGSSPEENARVLTAMLTPGAERVEPTNGANVDAIRDFILVNAAALLVVAGVADSYVDGVKRARESIESGKALEALDAFRKLE